jgi:D-glycero-alpha-D-manno-heptose-7-phosphate kinase
MSAPLARLAARGSVSASAPCRVDMGGTLDIRTFHLPLRRCRPLTVNLALDLRTRVRLSAGTAGSVRLASRGFEPLVCRLEEAPFDHPLGLMLAILTYFDAQGLNVEIDSASPPRSALGGSSSAAVALIAALSRLGSRGGLAPLTRRGIVRLAHALEESVAGVPCGMQDHLAAAFGGVHAWHWPGGPGEPDFRREPLLTGARARGLPRHMLLAYCGVPHASRDVNGTWVRQFLAGSHRPAWVEISRLAGGFARALQAGDLDRAAALINAETALRRALTPEVLDPLGEALVEAARGRGCGARFTGAGGGGCLWALGREEAIHRLRPEWQELAGSRPGAALLPVETALRGVLCEEP